MRAYGEDAPHTVLVSGAGGAGRTTVAAATACAAAAQGARTLLLSPEPEALLARLLGPVAEEPDRASEAEDGAGPACHRVAEAPGLWRARIDSAAEFRSRAVDWQQRGRQALEMLGASPMDEDELTELPGAGALSLLYALRAVHAEECGETPAPGCCWDTVVVDLPEAPRALQLLALPGQLRRYLRRLLPPERQAARALRPVLAQLAGVPMPGPWLYEAAAEWERGLAAVQRVVESSGTVLRFVVEPGEAAAETLRLARAGAGLQGLRLDGVLVNRLVPGAGSQAASGGGEWLALLAGRQRGALERIAAGCAEDRVPVHELPHLGEEPSGAAQLASLLPSGAGPPGPRAGEAYPPERLGPRGALEDRLDEEGHLVWRLALPGAERGELGLVRRGDELAVTVGPYRRVLSLPSALRRCRVVGAALEEGELRLRWEPDPAVWPAARDEREGSVR